MDSAYGSTFLTRLEPAQTAELVRDRVANSKASVDDVGEWFRELQGIEQTYYQALNKLATKSTTVDLASYG